MGDTAETIEELRAERVRLREEEERYRFLVTSVKSSPEYRLEAMAKLEAARRRIYAITTELNERSSNKSAT